MLVISTKFVGFENFCPQICKILGPILKTLTTSEFTVKDTFHFAEKIVDQQPDFIMGSSDVDSLFSNISLEENIKICMNELLKNLKLLKLKQLLSLRNLPVATKDSHFVFDGTHKWIGGVDMGSLLGPTSANVWLVFCKKDWLESFPIGYKPFYSRSNVDDKHILFNSWEHLKHFQSSLNSCHVNISFTIKNEKDMFFLKVNITSEQGKFTTSVYHKPTFSRIYTHFNSFFTIHLQNLHYWYTAI